MKTLEQISYEVGQIQFKVWKEQSNHNYDRMKGRLDMSKHEYVKRYIMGKYVDRKEGKDEGDFWIDIRRDR